MPPVSPSPVAVEFQHPGASARPVIRPACPGTTWHGGFDSGSLLAAVACALAGAAASGGAGVPGGVVWILVGAVSIGLAPGALRVAFAPGGTGRRCRAAVGVVVLAIAACGGGLAVSPFAAVAAAVVMLSLG